jgi:hypothetical protein
MLVSYPRGKVHSINRQEHYRCLECRSDDDIRTYVPELPDYSVQTGVTVTLRHMLNHTSGLRDYPSPVLVGGRGQ